MVYPASFLRLVASGPLYVVESWSWGLSLARFPASGEFAEVPDVVPEDVIAATTQFHQSIPTSAPAQLATIKLNLIGADGRYVNQSETVRHDYDVPVPGQGSGNVPPQVALALSLRTDKLRGRAHVGRIYRPVPTLTVNTEGMIAEGAAASAASALANYIQGLEDALPGWRVVVASNVGAGAFEQVTAVRCGRVLDTIRSRRRSLPENYAQDVPVTGRA